MSDKEKRKAKDEEASHEVAHSTTRFFMWVAIFLLAVGACVGPVGAYFYWTFNVAPAAPTADPLFIPTALPMVVGSPVPRFWNAWEYLDGSQAVMLNRLPNVINLAIVGENGRLTLTSDMSLVFTAEEPWQRAERPLTLETLTVTGTSVQLELSGLRRSVILNVLQPFVLSNNYQDLIYLVDPEGLLWSLEPDQAEWVSVNEAIGQLPVLVSPNPNMTIDIEVR